MATKKRLLQTDQEWLDSEPEPETVEDSPAGGKHIPIAKLRPLLDRLNCSTTNFKETIFTWKDTKEAFGSIELTATIDGKQRTVTGAYNIDVEKAIGGFWNGTLKSECVKNAAQELGRRLGRGLNVSEGVVASEVRKTEKPKPIADQKIMEQYLKAKQGGDTKVIENIENIYTIKTHIV